jgi:methionyl-tRNA formyltransferase
MRVVFLGSGPFAVPALEMLARSDDRPLLVVTRPDRPGGRGRKPTPTPVKTRAAELALPLEAPPSANDPAFVERLQFLSPDILIVSDYGEILREPLRAAARIGIFNLHGSLLPRHRGAAPVAAALLAGDEETGVTLFRITRGLDQGPVVDRMATAIGKEETAGELEARLAVEAARLLERNLARLARGGFPEEPQDESRATLAPKLPRGTGEIDWSLPAARLANFIRALSPRPGAFSFLRRADGAAVGEGEAERIRILRAREARPEEPPPAAPPPPGRVTRVEKHGFRVGSGLGELEVLELQPPGRQIMKSSEFLRGYPLSPGDRFGHGPPAVGAAGPGEPGGPGSPT